MASQGESRGGDNVRFHTASRARAHLSWRHAAREHNSPSGAVIRRVLFRWRAMINDSLASTADPTGPYATKPSEPTYLYLPLYTLMVHAQTLAFNRSRTSP